MGTIDSNGQRLSRRAFVVSSGTAAAGFALGFHFPGDSAAAQKASEAAGTEVNAWVVVKPDDTCVIRFVRSEMGQGTITGLAQLVAEELAFVGPLVVDDPGGRMFYQVTARSTGASGNTNTVLQTTYAKPE